MAVGTGYTRTILAGRVYGRVLYSDLIGGYRRMTASLEISYRRVELYGRQ